MFATPGSGGDTAVSLTDLRRMSGGGPSQPVSVPVSKSKWISMLNGGVKLPVGVDQQFFLNSTGH